MEEESIELKILVTGAKGFVGRNLAENLKNIRDGKNRTRPDITITEIFEYDVASDTSDLEEYCRNADFVFHLAGVNRPKDEKEYMAGNAGSASLLLELLHKSGNKCPVMFASSIQAALEGRFADSEYGRSKLAGEEAFLRYAFQNGSRVLIYRFPNIFGKWCRPNYNSAVATFCDAIANDRSYTVNDVSAEIELLYIDDLIEEMLDALEGKEHRCEYTGMEIRAEQSGRYCYVPLTYKVTLGRIVELLQSYKAMPWSLVMPDLYTDSFEKKLYSAYLSYLPERAAAYSLNMNVDSRGVFTELIRTEGHGQVSINIARPGVTRGEHWHNSKWEIFIVVSGHGLIRERRIGTDPETGREYPVMSFEVTGEQMKAVQMLPGYAHSITNLSDTENLVTVMWANEQFDEKKPDTYYESVVTRTVSDRKDKGKG